jgi:hypothetical protein
MMVIVTVIVAITVLSSLLQKIVLKDNCINAILSAVKNLIQLGCLNAHGEISMLSLIQPSYLFFNVNNEQTFENNGKIIGSSSLLGKRPVHRGLSSSDDSGCSSRKRERLAVGSDTTAAGMRTFDLNVSPT